MNQYITGKTIKELRERKGLTQLELASKLSVSDKAVSKWETGKGYPDITLLEPLSEILDVSVTELLSGNTITNMNISANLLRSKFYVCPVCGNIIHSMGDAVITCHGISLSPLDAENSNSEHEINVELIEDEYFVTVNHDMTKSHYISFIAAVSTDKIQIVKLYPEGDAQTRLMRPGVQKIYYYCNRDGLFCKKI